MALGKQSEIRKYVALTLNLIEVFQYSFFLGPKNELNTKRHVLPSGFYLKTFAEIFLLEIFLSLHLSFEHNREIVPF